LDVVAPQPALESKGDHLQVIADHASFLLGDLERAIAVTAHELRSPLLAARAAMIQVEEGASGTNATILRSVGRELEQLAELTDTLLYWAAGQAPIERAKLDLVRIVRDAAASCRFEAGEDRLVMRSPSRLRVHGDARHLRSAIANVLRNALAYSDPGSTVGIDVGRQAAGATIAITNSGPGLAPHEHAAIFEPFARGQEGRRARPGHGLGLFIAREVLEAHGGEITITASPQGTTFRLAIPTPRGIDQGQGTRRGLSGTRSVQNEDLTLGSMGS
jgi:signal transduction histidine kinase